MGSPTIVMLRVVIALSLAGSLVVQTVIVPLLWIDLEGEVLWARIALVVIAVVFVLACQVAGVCVWMLLTLVRRGTVFSAASFRYVDVIIGAVAVGALSTLALAALLAPGAVAPGVVALIGGGAFVMGGVALIVVVMRALLAQAVDREAEAARLRTELNEVI